jgi:hypothetical protein
MTRRIGISVLCIQTALVCGLAAAPATADLAIRDIEVTQVIQRLDTPLVRLIQGKPTVARVYVDSTTLQEVSGVGGYLQATLNGAPLTPAHKRCFNRIAAEPADPQKQYDDRRLAFRTLICPLPIDWLTSTGTLRIIAVVEAPGGWPDPEPDARFAGADAPLRPGQAHHVGPGP